MKLQGKVALVTGGGRGIGRGIALALAKEGADIAVVETDVLDNAWNQYGAKEVKGFPEAQKVAGEVKALGRRATAIKADVTKWDQVQAMVKQTVAELGGLDIVVNNAGVVHTGLIETMDEAEWDLTMDVNVKGVFLCSKAAIPYLKQRGGGFIINTASIAGKGGFATLAHYCASKHAVVGLTHSLAKELAKDNITVNAICPGVVWTQMWVFLAGVWIQPGESLEESWKRNYTTLIPQGRPQTAEDMGALAVYFATNPNVTGQSINVDGGYTIY
jgi:meso-butanediol dehydrogenase/(S,S)-butanediol dehydrogenase/diacetyl reductase